MELPCFGWIEPFCTKSQYCRRGNLQHKFVGTSTIYSSKLLVASLCDLVKRSSVKWIVPTCKRLYLVFDLMIKWVLTCTVWIASENYHMGKWQMLQHCHTTTKSYELLALSNIWVLEACPHWTQNYIEWAWTCIMSTLDKMWLVLTGFSWNQFPTSSMQASAILYVHLSDFN